MCRLYTTSWDFPTPPLISACPIRGVEEVGQSVRVLGTDEVVGGVGVAQIKPLEEAVHGFGVGWAINS